jgi:hypothetical protein
MSYWTPPGAELIEPYGPDVPNTLAKRHPHPRDEKIAFVNSNAAYGWNHKYFLREQSEEETLQRSRNLTSITPFVHKYDLPFDADTKSAQMQLDPKTAQKPKYRQLLAGVPQHQWAAKLKEEWAKNGQESAASGTQMHECLEDYVNGQPLRHDPPPPEFYLGVRFLDEAQREWDLVPFRSEWRVFCDDFPDVPTHNIHQQNQPNQPNQQHQQLVPFRVHVPVPVPVRYGLCGSIDLVMCYQHEVDAGRVQNVVVVDWKRVKELSMVEVYRGETLRDELSCMSNTNCSGFSLQTGTYKWTLEHYYGFKVAAHVLVCCIPGESEPLVYHAEDHPQLLAMMLERRAREFLDAGQ